MNITRGVIKIILLVSIFSFSFSFFQKDNLPPKEEILEDLYENPIQTKTESFPFKTEVNEVKYNIKPLYNYELYGLVVTYHHSDSFADYYHGKWKDYLNIKDICVVWGDNIESGVYEDLEFNSGSWTCYAEGDSEAWPKFKNSYLSNNHILSDEKEINKIVKNAERGDQIYFKGYLAEYSHKEGFRRSSSTSRDDTGNGACETVYVTDFKILKKANLFWRQTYNYSRYAIVICVILLIAIFFLGSVGSKHNSIASDHDLKNRKNNFNKYRDLLTGDRRYF